MTLNHKHSGSHASKLLRCLDASDHELYFLHPQQGATEPDLTRLFVVDPCTCKRRDVIREVTQDVVTLLNLPFDDDHQAITLPNPAALIPARLSALLYPQPQTIKAVNL